MKRSFGIFCLLQNLQSSVMLVKFHPGIPRYVPYEPSWYVIWRKRYRVNKALKTISEYVLFERLVLDMEVYRSDRSLVFLNIQSNYTYNSEFITFRIEPKKCTLDTDYMGTFQFHWTPDTNIVILKINMNFRTFRWSYKLLFHHKLDTLLAVQFCSPIVSYQEISVPFLISFEQ